VRLSKYGVFKQKRKGFVGRRRILRRSAKRSKVQVGVGKAEILIRDDGINKQTPLIFFGKGRKGGTSKSHGDRLTAGITVTTHTFSD
jgi:hypothetical protein